MDEEFVSMREMGRMVGEGGHELSGGVSIGKCAGNDEMGVYLVEVWDG